MAEYKCISCGEVRESESSCSCPVCGYMMFETPYDRQSILTSEIERFISGLEVRTLKREDLVFEGKQKDDNRFPDYDKILRYVSSQGRTENFLNNLLETVKQLKQHYASQFSNTYPVSFEIVNDEIEEYDEVLYQAAQQLAPGFSVQLEAVEWPKLSLLYAENQNKYLWSSVNELLDLMERLARKIARFIKVNNLYGNHHKYHPEKCWSRYTEKTDYKDELENAISETLDILSKTYVVDIADDGSAELREMLTCLWHAIELIMCSPLFIESYVYLTETGSISEPEMMKQLSGKLAERYKEFNETLNVSRLLSDKSDNEIFDLYK